MNKIIATILLTTLSYATDTPCSDGELQMMRVYVQKGDDISPLEIRTAEDGREVLIPDSRRLFSSKVSTGFYRFDDPTRNLCLDEGLCYDIKQEKTYYIVCSMDKNGNLTIFRTTRLFIYAFKQTYFHLRHPPSPNTTNYKDSDLLIMKERDSFTFHTRSNPSTPILNLRFNHNPNDVVPPPPSLETSETQRLAGRLAHYRFHNMLFLHDFIFPQYSMTHEMLIYSGPRPTPDDIKQAMVKYQERRKKLMNSKSRQEMPSLKETSDHTTLHALVAQLDLSINAFTERPYDFNPKNLYNDFMKAYAKLTELYKNKKASPLEHKYLAACKILFDRLCQKIGFNTTKILGEFQFIKLESSPATSLFIQDPQEVIDQAIARCQMLLDTTFRDDRNKCLADAETIQQRIEIQKIRATIQIMSSYLSDLYNDQSNPQEADAILNNQTYEPKNPQDKPIFEIVNQWIKACLELRNCFKTHKIFAAQTSAPTLIKFSLAEIEEKAKVVFLTGLTDPNNWDAVVEYVKRDRAPKAPKLVME